MDGVKSSENHIDRHVGQRIRDLRLNLGLTQQQLADLVGVTYQQAHKYERGINRVSAGRLAKIAKSLNVPIGYFFEGVEEAQSENPRERMTLEVARNFAAIRDPKLQELAATVVRGFAEVASP